MSLYQIGRELEALLVANGCPFPVVYRERTGTATWGRPRIVLEPDEDRFDAPISLSRDPKVHYTRIAGGKATIYAKSSKGGAQEFEHELVANAAIDQVLVAMRKIAAARHNRFVPVSGKFIVPKDLEKSELRAGAAYELLFTFTRAVAEQTWAKAIEPEGLITQGRNMTVVVDGNGKTPATACGA
ncbi:MAG: hypothetical protein FWD73_06930 [Polyangiaceae bacterium]|nr:hypothetical protein [Polyangiaceae bacterium]